MQKPFHIHNTETALFLAIEALVFYAGAWAGEEGDEHGRAGFLLLRPSVELLDDQGALALRALASLRDFEHRRRAALIANDVIRELGWPQKPVLIASKS